jgi:hypothetical protein
MLSRVPAKRDEANVAVSRPFEKSNGLIIKRVQFKGGRMRALLILAFLFLSTPTNADFFDGNELLEMCKQRSVFISGYVSGAIDKARQDQATIMTAIGDGVVASVGDKSAAALYLSIGNFCLPQEATVRQVTDMVCLYLNNKPAERHESGATLVVRVLAEGFPCRSSR